MYRYLAALMVTSLLTACQTQYEPLKLDASEPRVLTTGMSHYFEDTLAPMLERACHDCHLSSDSLETGFALASPISSVTNFENLLIRSHEAPITQSLTSPHPDISVDDLSLMQAFDEIAQNYWQWQSQLIQYENDAQTIFEESIEDDIIQPACSICHRLQDTEEPSLSGVLSFYGHTKEQHATINGQLAFQYLIREESGDLMLKKALGESNHGGGQVLPENSRFSDALQAHASAVNQYQSLLNQPPL